VYMCSIMINWRLIYRPLDHHLRCWCVDRPAVVNLSCLLNGMSCSIICCYIYTWPCICPCH